MSAALCYRPDRSAAQLVFATQPGAYTTETLIDFLPQLHAHFGEDATLTLLRDGLSSHRSRDMTAFIASCRGWLRVERLPTYAPNSTRSKACGAGLHRFVDGVGAALGQFGSFDVASCEKKLNIRAPAPVPCRPWGRSHTAARLPGSHGGGDAGDQRPQSRPAFPGAGGPGDQHVVTRAAGPATTRGSRSPPPARPPGPPWCAGVTARAVRRVARGRRRA